LTSEEIINSQAQLIKTLNQKILDQDEIIKNLYEIIDKLNQTIIELTEKLNKNSRNSSKPPSSDGLAKPSPKSLRKASNKKPGAQKGHPGANLTFKEEPDEIIQHIPSICQNCSSLDNCINKAGVEETRHIIDTVVKVKITAHNTLVMNCPLYNTVQKSIFPDSIKAPVQYGENLQALAVSLNTIGAVSIQRTHEILSSVFNISISTGTINAMVSRCAAKLEGTVEWIRQEVAASDIINNDETGTRVDGKTMWVHNASNKKYTYLSIHEKRGVDGMESAGVLPLYSGITVHDCWAPYWKYNEIEHAICCAHILRELIGVEENYPKEKWATAFKKLLLAMKAAKEKAIEKGKEKLSRYYMEKFDALYDQTIKQAKKKNPIIESSENKRGRKKKGKVRSLIDRLATYKDSICFFIKNFAVPFDNNQAERDIRMIKTKGKVSGCFRSMDGARDYLKIMSYVGTVKKHKKNTFEAIRLAIMGIPDTIFSN